MFREEDLDIGRRALERKWLTQAEMEDCLKSLNESGDEVSLADVFVKRGVLLPTQVEELLKETAPAPTVRRLAPGALFGKFRIDREIGRGGMGVVYEAFDTGLQRRIALKILADQLTAAQEDQDRFMREARLAARLRHPNVVAVHEVGTHEDVPYFAMDLIEGITLDRALAFEAGSSASPPGPSVPLPLTRPQKVDVVRKIALGIQAAHDLGIVHRDVKPANIILAPDGEPHITDFGLARDLSVTTLLTKTGIAMGTPNYMSPEQATGIPRAIDTRTDVYSLGAVLYHSITLRLPFLDESIPAMLVKVTAEDPPPARSIDGTIERPLEVICQKAMAKDKEQRYATAREFAEDLDRFQKGQPILAQPPGLGAIVARGVKRHRTIAAVVITALLVVGAFGVFLFTRPGGLKIVRDTPEIQVWIDGEPLTTPDIKLKRGTHEVRAARPGFRDWRRVVSVEAGQWLTVAIRLEPRMGTIRLRGVPVNARVRIEAMDGSGEVIEQEGPGDTRTLREIPWRVTAWAPGTQFASMVVMVEDGRGAEPDLELPAAVVWRYVTGEKIYRLPAAADLNGDGVPDIVVPSKDGKVYAIDGRLGKLLWGHDTRNASHTDPVILDIEGDGSPEVLFGVGTVGFQCLRGANGDPRFSLKDSDAANRTFVAPENVDLNADNFSDLFIAGWSGRVTCVSGKPALQGLKIVPVWYRETGARIEGPPLIGDVDANMELDVAVVTHAARVHFFLQSTGEPIGEMDLPAEPSAPSLMSDVNGDGSGDVLVPLVDGRLVCLSKRLKKILWTFASGAKIQSRPVAADLDGDGALEVVFGSDDAHVYALDGATGALKWKFRTGQEVHGSPAVGDIDGDGLPEVVVGSDRLYVADGRTGMPFWWFLAAVDGTPLLVDLDYDGRMEIVVGSDDHYVYALKVGNRR